MAEKQLTEQGMDILFREARSANAWQSREVSDELLNKIYDLMKWGPTSANCCPLRIVFLKTSEAKERLKPALMEGNVGKTMTAPVVAILAHDTAFYEHLSYLFPHIDAKPWFAGNMPLIEETAFRNGSLQAAYFMMAARAYGLDCGAMSGFDKFKVNREFFPDDRFRVNFICNLGYADHSKTFPRSPRLKFEDACTVL